MPRLVFVEEDLVCVEFVLAKTPAVASHCAAHSLLTVPILFGCHTSVEAFDVCLDLSVQLDLSALSSLLVHETLHSPNGLYLFQVCRI